MTEDRTAEELARRTQRLEAVIRLVRAVTHDFNNMLAAVLGTADLLAIRLKDNDAARDDAEAIRRAAEEGAALTRRLVALTRSQMQEPRLFDVAASVRDELPHLQQIAGGGITIRTVLPDAPATVRVEPGHLEQMLVHLVTNAVEAMPSGGELEIGVERVTLQGTENHRYPALPDGPYVVLRVRDSGRGIDPRVQPHIFEPFFTTKTGVEGAGLGLAIVQGLARDGGGTVTYATTGGRGTTFEVVLPYVEPAA